MLANSKEVVTWLDSHNLCSIEHGLWLTADDFNTFKKQVVPDDSILRWLTRNNAFADASWGINIGSDVWQPARKELMEVKVKDKLL